MFYLSYLDTIDVQTSSNYRIVTRSGADITS